MATIKVRFVAPSRATEPGLLCYQVSHNRETRRIATDLRLYASEWNARQSRVAAPCFTGADRRKYLNVVQERIDADLDRIRRITAGLLGAGECTAEGIARRFCAMRSERSFFAFMEEVIARLRRINKDRTTETYTAALNSFRRFRENQDVMMDEIDADLLASYESFLRSRGLTKNTISFYNRILRAVYNRAVEKGITEQRHPFRHVYTGIDRTVKRAISLDAIRRIKSLDLSGSATLDRSRDLFLFSFYTRGMSFIDMAYLRKSDLKNGMLVYSRHKTGQRLFVKWEPCMQAIVDKHADATSEYLLPIITHPHDDVRRQYNSALHLVNHQLKRVAELVGLTVPLTTYVSRHTWASIAKGKNIPLPVISEGMGHDSPSTTQIYLASFANSVIDQANQLILSEL